MIKRRHTQSKTKIKTAITELLVENSDFNDITIRKITEKAHINRSTFYLHYQDKYDLIDKLMHDITDNLKKELNTSSLNIRDSLIQGLIYLQSQQTFIQSVITIAPVNFSQKARQFIKELIDEIPSFFYDSINPNSGLPKDYMVITYAASLESLYMHWVLSGAQESPQEIADMFLIIRGFYQNP
ncbi:TetR/AcrR family transcriptional regulator [Streptococcus devriesei]|uniref:TetR/AcrR family transcriptional regulator n=1 Tax=Streptococcus devriesei TaxID=231233 RepID=UPI0003F7EE03|nr:TetR/AcrR family transcriptional regulator C-terminal domain-containing protein [Streptococcus devriesei]